MSRLDQELASYLALKKRIKSEFALDDDAQELLDTLEGETNLHEVIAYLARKARFDEANAAACATLIEDMKARKSRLEERAKALRWQVTTAMRDAGLKKVEAPDSTISFRDGARRIVKSCDAKDAPEGYRVEKITYGFDNDAIKDALDAGKSLNFAAYDKGDPYIQMTVK